MIEPILQKLKVPCENAVKDAKLSHHELQEVVLVGGSTRIPVCAGTGEADFRQGAEQEREP